MLERRMRRNTFSIPVGTLNKYVWLAQSLLLPDGSRLDMTPKTVCWKNKPQIQRGIRWPHPSSVVFLHWSFSSNCYWIYFPNSRVTWPGLYRMLIRFLHIVVWHMRVLTRLLEVTCLECEGTLGLSEILFESLDSRTRDNNCIFYKQLEIPRD